jgi:hypothetical protein
MMEMMMMMKNDDDESEYLMMLVLTQSQHVLTYSHSVSSHYNKHAYEIVYTHLFSLTVVLTAIIVDNHYHLDC